MAFNYDDYFEWLYKKAFADDSYLELAKILFNIRFTWSVSFDKNRAADGISMRRSYLFENGRARESYHWDDSECTFFEMFVGLATKFAMLLDKDVHDSVLHLLRNTEFYSMKNGYVGEYDALAVTDTIMDRTYDFDGDRGFFPLRTPKQDQRDVELLYQMNQYIIEYGW